MKWKKRQKELDALRAKHGRDRSMARSFPDLSVPQRTSPTSGRVDIVPTLKKEILEFILGSEFVVYYNKKSGYEVLKVGGTNGR
jgi:hypothetical protein